LQNQNASLNLVAGEKITLPSPGIRLRNQPFWQLT